MKRIVAGAEDYPSPLLELPDPPLEIFVRGECPSWSPSVAIVGTRACTPRGFDFAKKLAAELASEGFWIVSGGALGIDSAAHQGALEVDGRTVVVMAGPLERPVPTRNSQLFQRVLERGAWISEVSSEGTIHRASFVQRNRLIAALADVVVVVEAREKSGTQSTVRWARRLKRPVGAVPWGLDLSSGAGCLNCLRDGAAVVTSARDVLALLGRPSDPSPRAAEVTEEEAQLLAYIEEHGVIDTYLAADPARAWTLLSHLELRGIVEPRGGSRFAVLLPYHTRRNPRLLEREEVVFSE